MKIIWWRWLRHFENTANLRRFWSITTNHYSTSKIEIKNCYGWLLVHYFTSFKNDSLVKVHFRQMSMNIKMMKRCFTNWRYLMHFVALICFASMAYQARFVSPLSMVKPNEASQNCCIRSKCVRFNTPPISIWFCTRHLYCLQLGNKFFYARKITLCSVRVNVAK